MNHTIEFCIFELFWVPNFGLNRLFYFFQPNCPERVIPMKNRKTENHH